MLLVFYMFTAKCICFLFLIATNVLSQLGVVFSRFLVVVMGRLVGVSCIVCSLYVIGPPNSHNISARHPLICAALRSLVHCRNSCETSLPIKWRIATQLIIFKYRPITFAKHGKGKWRLIVWWAVHHCWLRGSGDKIIQRWRGH